jgi:hypothetical protein
MVTIIKELFAFVRSGHDLNYLHEYIDNNIKLASTYEKNEHIINILNELKNLSEYQLRLFINSEFSNLNFRKQIDLSMIDRIRECKKTNFGVYEKIEVKKNGK